MKPYLKLFGRLLGSMVLLAAFGWTASAQETARLRLDGLNKLEASAAQTIDVNVDGKLLQLAIRVLSAGEAKNPDLAKIREAVVGLKGVYVKSYEFANDNAYSLSDLEDIRAQLKSGVWERMAGVRSKKDGQNVEVFTAFDGDRIGGLTVIAHDTRHITVVNIVGMVDLEKLMALQGSLGIPKVDIGIENKDKPKE
jgi:hypothetical protein